MAERSENRRATTRPRRNVEIGCDVKARTTFERDLLDAIAGAFNRSHDARVKRRPIERTSKHLPQLVDDGLLTIEHALSRRNRIDDSLASIARLGRHAHQITLEVA